MTVNLTVNPSVQSLLSSLAGGQWLSKPDWPAYVGIDAPYAKTEFEEIEVQQRFQRYDYDWDIHGRLYVPRTQVMPGCAFVLIHGGGVNELDFQQTPDGRPGLARVLASQCFQVLTPSYPGLWPPGGKWRLPIEARRPIYLFDRELDAVEIADRVLKATYQMYMQGIAALVEQCLFGQKLLAMGHSTGGPMAADLYEYLSTASVAGIVGWGSGGCDGWISQWNDATGAPRMSFGERPPLGGMIYRTVEEYRHASGYEDVPELTPWGRMEERFALVNDSAPGFNPELQVVSHQLNLERLREYHAASGLPLSEYMGHYREPAPVFLRGLKVLLMVGENDKHHWKAGGELPEARQDGFIARRYAERCAGAHLIVIPRYTHMGHWALYNEKLAYIWLWAVKSGYFGSIK